MCLLVGRLVDELTDESLNGSLTTIMKSHIFDFVIFEY